MAAQSNGSPRYEVHGSSAIAQAIRNFHHRATRQGRGATLSKAIRQILDRLERDPFDVGEPAYRLAGLRLQVRTVIVRPLVIDFAVSEELPIVFIKGVKLLSTPK
jgi:hypothetical protein